MIYTLSILISFLFSNSNEFKPSQGNVAHLMRIGKLLTLEKELIFKDSSLLILGSLEVSILLIFFRKKSIKCFVSLIFFFITNSVIIDEAAKQIAQPLPRKEISLIISLSSNAKIYILSPHNGL